MLDLRPLPANEAPDLIEELVSANGNLHLVAERTGSSRLEVLTAVSDNMPRMQKLIKARTLIETFDLIDRFKNATMMRMHELEAGDVAKTFTTLVQLLTTLTDDKTYTNVNVHEYVWNQLPPHIRNMIIDIQASTTEDEPNSKLEPTPILNSTPDNSSELELVSGPEPSDYSSGEASSPPCADYAADRGLELVSMRDSMPSESEDEDIIPALFTGATEGD